MELLDTAQKVFISIVKYAYPTQDGIVKISLNYMREQQVIEVSFINEGIPYNPLEALNNSTRLTRENRLESKIGISIIEKVTEETSYLYLNKKNITAIRKYIV
jgi:anti-sigma regulatory factor (Ser/Thr protein kinase)